MIKTRWFVLLGMVLFGAWACTSSSGTVGKVKAGDTKGLADSAESDAKFKACSTSCRETHDKCASDCKEETETSAGDSACAVACEEARKECRAECDKAMN